ncbi:formyltetrahydrofolate deformylase [Saxibacter everestensis]|uniref:Formyltetrahydrofolate deformylase n=1 Tax=Saxibacter everestensis TaxID=2909229 RepID=A0ABY8QRT4_9MICO|nr:formyltetrahydrofolate deformylase [Brevibacteriaceae bacterium ZFBP1038]
MPDDATPTNTEWVLTISCPDRPGIVHAVTGILVQLGANITESQQFGNPDSEHFFLRLQFVSAATEQEIANALRPVADELSLEVGLDRVGRPVRTLVMVSKAGHCLNDLLFRQRSGQLPIEVVGVVGNHTDLAGLAEFYGVPFHHVPVTAESKEQSEATISELVDSLDVELVVLARYMQILSAELCDRLRGKVINIHHSFLPSFKGARPYHQAHKRGVKLIGATAHFVTTDLDEGPIIEQDVARVDHNQRISDFVALGQEIEARTLARAVKWHAQGRIILDGQRTVIFR